MKVAIICFQDYEDVEHSYYEISGVNWKRWLKWIGGEFIGFTNQAKRVINAKKNVEDTIIRLQKELKIAEKYIEKNKNKTDEEWNKLDEEYNKRMANMSSYYFPPSAKWQEAQERPKEIAREIKQAEKVLEVR